MISAYFLTVQQEEIVIILIGGKVKNFSDILMGRILNE